MVELHGERGGVEQDGGKDGVFTERGGGKRPQSVLERVFRNVSSDRLGIEGILYTVTLQKKIDIICCPVLALKTEDVHIRCQSENIQVLPDFCLRHNLGRRLHPRFGR